MTRRPLDATTGLTHTRGSMGDGTIRGKARIATPYDPRRLRTAARAGSGAGPTPVGHTVTIAHSVTSTGKVTWDTVIRGSGFIDTDPDPRVRILGYYDVDVRVDSNAGPVRDLLLTVTIGETVTSLLCPFSTRWEGTIPDVLGSPGDRVELEVAWAGSADVDVQMTVGLDEPLAAVAIDVLVFESLTGIGQGNSSSGTAVATVTAPAATQEGDLLLVAAQTSVVTSFGYGTWTPPNDVNLLHQFPTGPPGGSNGSGAAAGLWWKWADATDAAQGRNYTTQLTGSGVQFATIGIIPVRGVPVVSNPFAGVNVVSGTTGADVSRTTRSVTAPSGQAVIGVAFGVRNVNNTFGSDYVMNFTAPMDRKAFWAASGFGGFGYESTSSSARRGGHNATAFGLAGTDVEVEFGESYTHQWIVAAGLA